jgi:hypothetical protein
MHNNHHFRLLYSQLYSSSLIPHSLLFFHLTSGCCISSASMLQKPSSFGSVLKHFLYYLPYTSCPTFKQKNRCDGHLNSAAARTQICSPTLSHAAPDSTSSYPLSQKQGATCKACQEAVALYTTITRRRSLLKGLHERPLSGWLHNLRSAARNPFRGLNY